MFPDNEMARMKIDVLVTMPDTCTILTPVQTRDNTGGQVTTWTTTSTNVPCRLDGATGAARMTYVLDAGAPRPEGKFMLTLPVDVALTEFQRVVTGGDTYQVKAVMRGSEAIVGRFLVDLVK
jgi:hypothetical protein